ncbi:MAG: hypothetical protein IKP12_01055 [Acholeplasmatales bacterium]|nr:hypothetical protein [Acholeplasmatales bacterium]
MKRFLKRFLFPIIITVLVITIFCLFNLAGGMFDDGEKTRFTVYELMFGGYYGSTKVEMLGVSAVGVLVTILLILGALISWFDFKYDKFVVASIFCISTILIMLLPIGSNKTEVGKNLISVIEANGDKQMTILVGPYLTASFTLIISCFALFKTKFNSLIKISK